MAFWQSILGAVSGSAVFTPRVTHLGSPELVSLANPSNMTATQMWRTQPHLRTVVAFLARNVAQLGLHVFERAADGDRHRDRTSDLARVLREVDGTMTPYELTFALVGDLALYDRAYWWVAPSSDTTSGWMIRRLPPTWVEPVRETPWKVSAYRVYVRADGAPETIPAENILPFAGYDPDSATAGSPTVDALRETLREQVEAAKYRSQVWRRGGRVSAVLERPANSRQWSDEARAAFREDWYAKFTGDGSRAGGTPILEDGMTLKTVDFSARDQQFVEAAKLSLTTVAAAYHVNPTMIGQNDGATYANVREFRKMLYGDTIGPLLAQIESRLNTFLVPRLGLDPATHYVEFNIEEKLQGNFEEQAAQLQASVGGPWMTRNEARGMRNLPALPGGDELITPLNVITGGQASPLDSGSQNRNTAPATASKAAPPTRFELKAPAEDTIPADQADALGEVFARHAGRQRAVVLTALGAKAPTWWDAERWDRELTEDLLDLGLDVATTAAREVLEQMGGDPAAYSEARTRKFLTAVSERIARQVNASTLTQLEDALAARDDEEEDADPVDAAAHVFDVAEDSRAAQSGMTAAATYVGFGLAEGPRQTMPRAMKTWVVNSDNPRASHAALDGEEVGIDEDFSNGMPWPGSFTGDPEDIANCQCSLIITR
ncbi:phage portal protein [Micrococcus sp. NPDC078436]|uniref:phage portal protein n=1 Tax=Micrococcus sp. NPDC078436 TaxID=3154960 RepID=UPI0034507403